MKELAPLRFFFFGVVMWGSWNGVVITGLRGSLQIGFSWVGRWRKCGPASGFRFELAAGGEGRSI